MSYSETISYNDTLGFNFDSALVEVAAGTLRLKDQGGGVYSTANPVVTSQHANPISSLSSFSESSSTPANTAIQYQLVLDGLPYWYNASSGGWQASDGTFAQSNTAAVINSNCSTLFSGLGLLVPQYLSLRVFLSTTSASARPALISNTFGYTFQNGNPQVISQCLLYGYLSDLLGSNPVPSSSRPISLIVSCDHAFWHGSRFVLPFTKSAQFDSSGYCELSVIETATPGIKLSFALTYYDGLSLVTARLFTAIVPNQPTIALGSLSPVVPYSFG